MAGRWQGQGAGRSWAMKHAALSQHACYNCHKINKKAKTLAQHKAKYKRNTERRRDETAETATELETSQGNVDAAQTDRATVATSVISIQVSAGTLATCVALWQRQQQQQICSKLA